MAKREKFGKFVLLEEVEASGLGAEYRAAKLSATGLEKIVVVLRVRPDLSANGEMVKSLMDQVKFAAQLQNPNIVKLFGVGKVEASFYVSHEFLEAKSLHAIFARGRTEGFPFSVDHTLLIASKICSALEYAHSRKTEAGTRYFHGMVTPGNVLVSYEGEVRLRGFGYWPARVREAGGTTSEEALYLAPEQAAGAVGDTRSDIFAVGALLFQMLTGEPFFAGGREIDFPKRLADAKLLNPTTDDESLPKPIREILKKSLTKDPAGRYAEAQEMRKAVDTLLFSGDFTPTTFNLAFFMHSLFRDTIDRESKTLKEEKEASYAEYLTEDVKSAPKTSPGMPVPSPAAIAAAGAAMAATAPPAVSAEPVARPPATSAAPAASSAASSPPLPLVPPPPPHAPIRASGPHPSAEHGHGALASPSPSASAHASTAHAPAEGVSAREAAAGFTFHKDEGARSKLPLIGGLAAVALAGAGVAAFFVLRGRTAPPPPVAPPPTTMSAEAAAAVTRVKELEDKLKALEGEKAAASAKAEEDARKKVEAQAAARGQAVDPEKVARAQEEARKRAQAEQERKADQERRRLEEEQKAAQAQLAEEKRKADEAARLAAAAAAATTLPPAPPTTVAVAAATPPPAAPATTAAAAPAPPAIKPGALVDINEPGVIAPVALNKPSFTYPPIALRQRIEGKVDLSVLVDERGAVADTKVVTAAGGKAGLNEAASDYVRRWKFRPATKDGVAVKAWTPVSVVFMLPR